MDAKEILSQLNESQRAAVEYCDGPSLVIAGAGSGKTRVLTYKVAYLLTLGVKPWSILALTFTNKAANEMKERINALVGGNQARYIYMGTFHSIFARILRSEASALGYMSNFTIYDDADSKSLVKTIIKERKLNDKVYKPSLVASRISMAKNCLLLPADYAQDRQMITHDYECHTPEISNIYAEYCARCKRANAMDFDDLLLNTYLLFSSNPEILDKYATNFQYVMVDEYQDTNAVQQKIAAQLASRHHRICAVGDDAQSIYAFRGANIDNMLRFEETYSGARTFKLEQNYRSTRRIVEAANTLISHNQWQIRKQVVSMNGEGDRLKLKMAYSDKEESAIVCNDIRTIMAQDARSTYNDFAILYRTNAQSRPFEEALRKAGMPYKIYGGLSFYQRKEIKDVIAYFRLVTNPDDEEALKRIINYPARGIGAATLQKIADAATAQGVSLWSIIADPAACGLAITKATLSKLEKFTTQIASFISRLNTDDAYTLGYDIIKQSGIAADLYSNTAPEGIARQENLEEFLGGMQDFVEGRREDATLSTSIHLTDFLQEVSLLTDLESTNEETDEHINLMTIHSAKGLEFRNVFVVGLEENIFPSPMACNSPRELEEERRLLYVAITRAENFCELTCARNRYRYGKMEFDTPSRFIKDIDQKLLECSNMMDGFQSSSPFGGNGSTRFDGGKPWQSGRWQNSHPVASQFRADPKPRIVGHQDDTYHFQKGDYKKLFSPDKRYEGFTPLSKLTGSASGTSAPSAQQGGASTPSNNATAPNNAAPTMSGGIAPGSVVEHNRFGIGTVLRIEGSGENTKCTIKFNNVGTKQLLMKFARLRIVR